MTHHRGAAHHTSYCVLCRGVDTETSQGHHGFPCGSAGKESACNAGDLSSIPELGRPPGEGKGYPLQYSGLEKSMDGIPWGHDESDTTERLHFHTFRIIILKELWLRNQMN